MRSRTGAASISRRSFLSLTVGAATAAGTVSLSGCALSVSSGTGGSLGRDSVTVMATDTDFGKDTIKAAAAELGIRVGLVPFDITRLTAMLSSGQPPDLVRGMGALDTPYLVAREVAEDLDPYFARSGILRPSDLDPVNDVWRFDGRRQGAGPRYGMTKDYSQDSMYWYNTALFDAAGVAPPPETTPLSREEWLDLGKRLTRRDKGRTAVYGMSANGTGYFSNFMSMTASAGGRLFTDGLDTVDFSSPEARKALSWYIDYAKNGLGPSLVNPDPNGWDWPTYQAGRMAMPNQGYWFGGSIGTDRKIAASSRLAPAPQFSGGTRISPCTAATGFWMPRAGRRKELAWRLFEWYFGESPARQRAGSGFGIPTLKSLHRLMPRAQPYQRQALRVQQAELEHFSVLSFTPYVRAEALDGVIGQVLPAALNGEVSAGKVADRLNRRMNHQISLGKQVVS